jgi:hypothetical protein
MTSTKEPSKKNMWRRMTAILLVLGICGAAAYLAISGKVPLGSNQQGSAAPSQDSSPLANPLETVPAEKGGRFEGNYAHFGAAQIRAGRFAKVPYAIHVVGPLSKSNQDAPTEQPTRIWLTHKLGRPGCGGGQDKCDAEQIVDMVDGPQYTNSMSIVMPDNGVPCTWHDSQVLAFHNGAPPVTAAWRIDFQAEKIVPVPAGEVDCQARFDEEGKGKRANELLADGWGGDAIHGYEGIQDIKKFREIGKVEKEDTQVIPKEGNAARADELHHYHYDGMSVSAYLARSEDKDQIRVNEVVVTSSNWPVKHGLTVGTPRKKIEETLGENSNMSDNPREWSYADGARAVIFAFDDDDKVKEIRWQIEGSAE